MNCSEITVKHPSDWHTHMHSHTNTVVRWVSFAAWEGHCQSRAVSWSNRCWNDLRSSVWDLPSLYLTQMLDFCAVSTLVRLLHSEFCFNKNQTSSHYQNPRPEAALKAMAGHLNLETLLYSFPTGCVSIQVCAKGEKEEVGFAGSDPALSRTKHANTFNAGRKQTCLYLIF